MIALPYIVTQTHKNVSMIILKPKPNKSLGQISALETLDNFLEDFDQIDPEMVDLKMPKFKFGKSTEVVDVLKEMGLGAMFQSGHGGFGNMVSEHACVSDVKHRAWVAVDEDGTEAAAATVVLKMKRLAPEAPKNPI
jgi:serpin B